MENDEIFRAGIPICPIMHSIPERCGDVNHKIELFLKFFYLPAAYDFETRNNARAVLARVFSP
jgi:hypothetical protein